MPDITEAKTARQMQEVAEGQTNGTSTTVASAPIDLDTLTLAPKVPFRVRLRRQFTPLKLSIVGVILLIGVSGYLYWWRTQVQWAQANYPLAVENAYAALAEQQVDEANAQFEIASRSAIILGLDDEQAQGVKQYARELDVLDRLSSQPFPELLTELSESSMELVAGDEQNDQQSVFYWGKDWYVLDVWGKVVKEEENRWLELEAPVPLKGSTEFMIRINLPNDAVTDRPPNALNQQHFVLATRCDRMVSKTKPTARWTLYCEETFLWEHDDSLRILGLYADDEEGQVELAKLLKNQSTLTAEQKETEQADAAGGEL
ncbi:MAG: hypothetical protein R3C11_26830 [Planctomycetaceae bacterium]